MYLAMEMENSQSRMTAKPTPIEPTAIFASANDLYLQTYSFYDIKLIEAEILPFLIRLFRRYNGRYSASDILNRVTKNKQQIWLARELKDDSIAMVCLTEIVEYPQLSSLYITDVVGKDYKRWIWIEGEIAKWAKSIGCKKIETEARKGWDKWKPEGYKVEKLIITKDI